MKDDLDVNLALDAKTEEVASVSRGVMDVVDRIAVATITLAVLGGVVSVFALLLGCCHG